MPTYSPPTSARSGPAARNPTLAAGLAGAIHGAVGLVLGPVFTEALREMEEAQWLPPEVLSRRAEGRLEGLLQHAVTTVPFYRELFRERGWNPDELRASDLPLLPVVDKAVFRGRPAEAFLANGVPPHRRLPFTTSGSTGDPFAFFLDRRMMPRVLASHRFYDSWFALGPLDRCERWMVPLSPDPPPKSAPLAQRIRASAASRLRSLYESWAQPLLDLTRIPATDPAELHRAHLHLRPAAVMGYASTLAAVSASWHRLGLRASTSVRAVITIAEPLSPLRRAWIERCFDVPIVDRYGQRELKFWCAQSCPHQPEKLHFNPEVAFWEVVTDSGAPTPPGEIGRVVLTNLHNFVMPFIRYDTGDLATAGTETCPCGRGFPLIGPIQGRGRECFRTAGGELVTPRHLGLTLRSATPETVVEYQLRKPPTGCLTLCVVPGPTYGARVRRLLRAEVSDLLGEGVEVEAVGSLPLERSGKRPLIRLGSG